MGIAKQLDMAWMLSTAYTAVSTRGKNDSLVVQGLNDHRFLGFLFDTTHNLLDD